MKMGIATTCYLSTRRFGNDTLAFLEHAHSLGAGGIQASLAPLSLDTARALRRRAEQVGMYVEFMIGLPGSTPEALEKCQTTVAAAREAGALCVRANCGGRRYEDFTDLATYQRTVTNWLAAIGRALPIVEKHRIPLAIENHKDWLAADLVSVMRNFSSSWLGVCLDTGNSISLCEDPWEVIEALAPYAISTHVKDMGLAEDGSGFLLSEVPLGEGMLDMKRLVDTIHRARPETRFTLEMITRDPLRVPCLTPGYWATFPDRGALDLARTLRLVRERATQRPLPRTAGLPPDQVFEAERRNVVACLDYAQRQLAV